MPKNLATKESTYDIDSTLSIVTHVLIYCTYKDYSLRLIFNQWKANISFFEIIVACFVSFYLRLHNNKVNFYR